MKKDGQVRIEAIGKTKAVELLVALDVKGKPFDNAGVMATLTNELVDALRKHFCAHEIRTIGYRPPRLSKRAHLKIKIGR